MPTRYSALAAALLVGLPSLFSASVGLAQETWQRNGEPRYDGYQADPPANDDAAGRRPDRGAVYPPNGTYAPQVGSPRPPVDDAYRPPQARDPYAPPRQDGWGQSAGSGYAPPPGSDPRQGAYPGPSTPSYGQAYGQAYGQPYTAPRPGYGEPYSPAPAQPGYGPPPSDPGYGPPPGQRFENETADGSYSSREILEAGRTFFGSVSKGLANVVEYAFKQQGRPNGYILGEDAGGAFVAGLRYGEGMLYTKDAGAHRVYWQGPSIGWDAGAAGSKVMVLVYNLRDPEEIYQRFAGVDGSAYLVGGVGLTFQKSGPVIVAPIRSGLGLRLGANIGYLKYTHQPTWNPF
jgi:hypothetical protein